MCVCVDNIDANDILSVCKWFVVTSAVRGVGNPPIACCVLHSVWLDLK